MKTFKSIAFAIIVFVSFVFMDFILTVITDRYSGFFPISLFVIILLGITLFNNSIITWFHNLISKIAPYKSSGIILIVESVVYFPMSLYGYLTGENKNTVIIMAQLILLALLYTFIRAGVKYFKEPQYKYTTL